MKTKILSFKFKKKNSESQEKAYDTKKNYENIFNNILNGGNNNKISNDNKENSLEKKIPIKKNKIKCILKLNDLNIQEGKKNNIINLKEIENINIYKKINYKNNNNKEHNEIKSIFKTEKNLEPENKINKSKDHEIKSKVIMNKNINKSLAQRFDMDKNILDEHLISVSNSCGKENKRNIIFNPNSRKIKEFQQNDSIIKYNRNNYIKIKGHIKNESKTNKGKKKIRERATVSNMKQFILSQDKNNTVNINKSNIKSKRTISFKKKENNNKNFKNIKKDSKKFSIHKLKKNNIDICSNKITITNDNFNQKINFKKKINGINYNLNNESKGKKLILNNTNSNINININITNINDKAINKKENEFIIYNENKIIPENNNIKNNMTTVNIINNNNNRINRNNKKKLKDGKLFFYDSSNKNKVYLDKINHPKGIKIREININLGEEQNNNNKNEFKKYLTQKDNIKSDFINLNYFGNNKESENDKLDVKSEYEHFHDIDDFWSNRSLTSYSCKSGFTASRKLRSLSRERDRVKLLNKCQKKSEKDIEYINNKLLKIVDNFHKNDSSNNIKINKKTLKDSREKYKASSKYNTIDDSGKNRKRNINRKY